MALKAKIDAKSTYHFTLTGDQALIMNAMILMFGGGAKSGAQYVVSELVSDEYKRQKSSIDTFIAENRESLAAMGKPEDKRTTPPQQPAPAAVNSETKAAHA